MTSKELQIKSKLKEVIFMKKTCTHELGHAMGYCGHSKTEKELMYTNTKKSDMVLTVFEKQHLKVVYDRFAN